MISRSDLIRVAPAFVAFGFIFAGCGPAPPVEQDKDSPEKAEADWLTSYDAAIKTSTKTGKPILIDFTGVNPSGDYWCEPCRILRQRVFDTAVFKKWAEENVVLLEVELPNPYTTDPPAEAGRLQRKYGIDALPTVAIVRSDGALVGETGYSNESAEGWIQKVKGLVRSATHNTKETP